MADVICDVLIIGAGPAGLSAAISCAEQKLSTVVVEKQNFAGNDIRCAEGIGSYLLDLLPFKVNFGRMWPIEGIDFFCYDYLIKRRGDYWAGYTIDRSFFEKDLLKKVINLGAKAYFGFELKDIDFSGKKSNIYVNQVKIKSMNSLKEISIKPKVLIAADGSFACVSKKLNLYKATVGETGFSYSFELSNLKLVNPHIEQLFIGEFAEGGYGYIFPKSNNVANIGIGCTFKKKDLSEMYANFTKIPIVAEQLKNSRIIKDKTKEVVWGDVVKKMRFGNVVFCGDSVNHNLKPFLEGILPGVISGYNAGKLSNLYLKNNKIDLDYADLINKKYLEIWDYSKKVQNVALDIFLLKQKMKRHLLFFSLVSQEFELEKITDLINSDEKLVKELMKNQNLTKVKDELKK